ncbi:MAG: hypothetical protein ABFD94_09300 [Armatimonadia bacterium]
MRILIALVGLLCCVAAWPVTVGSVDLIDGLNSGALWAEFHGAGDRAVSGTIGRTSDAPLVANIAPGTQFWAQAGGRQGQATIGSVPVDLTGRRVATITIHTCCTNLGLPEATAADTMVPVASPNPSLAGLLALPGIESRPHMAVQAAVWALANNPRGVTIRRALRGELPRSSTQAERGEFCSKMVALAEELVRSAGLEPRDYNLFR